MLAEIEAEAAATNTRNRRMGILDWAWFLLMLHSGLRTGEVRRLRQADLDLKGGRVRIEQSKGLKDRIVYLSAATVAAIEVYLEVRGPAAVDHLLLYRLSRAVDRQLLRLPAANLSQTLRSGHHAARAPI